MLDLPLQSGDFLSDFHRYLSGIYFIATVIINTLLFCLFQPCIFDSLEENVHGLVDWFWCLIVYTVTSVDVHTQGLRVQSLDTISNRRLQPGIL